MSTVVGKTSVRTRSAERYLQQLSKHWSHNLEVQLVPGHGSVVFPRDLRGADFPADAVVTFRASDEALQVSIAASAPDQLDNLKDVLARHLDRFAYREAPLALRWDDTVELAPVEPELPS